MIDALNLIGVNAAVPGNHDFDCACGTRAGMCLVCA